MGEYQNSNSFMHVLICYPSQPEIYSIHQDYNLEHSLQILKRSVVSYEILKITILP